MRQREHSVGFYKDERGRLRLIAKSDEELSRKRVIENPKEFKSIRPEKTSLTRRLKELQSELEKIGRKFDNVCDEEEAEAIIKLGEAKFKEAKKIEKELLRKHKLQEADTMEVISQ